MAGQKKRKLAHILNLGNWANKKKKKLPQVAPTDEGLGVIPAIATTSTSSADSDSDMIEEVHHDAENATWINHDSTQGDDINTEGIE
jgi:hypothetical protein